MESQSLLLEEYWEFTIKKEKKRELRSTALDCGVFGELLIDSAI